MENEWKEYIHRVTGRHVKARFAHWEEKFKVGPDWVTTVAGHWTVVALTPVPKDHPPAWAVSPELFETTYTPKEIPAPPEPMTILGVHLELGRRGRTELSCVTMMKTENGLLVQNVIEYRGDLHQGVQLVEKEAERARATSIMASDPETLDTLKHFQNLQDYTMFVPARYTIAGHIVGAFVIPFPGDVKTTKQEHILEGTNEDDLSNRWI